MIVNISSKINHINERPFQSRWRIILLSERKIKNTTRKLLLCVFLPSQESSGSGRARPGSDDYYSPTWDGGQGQSDVSPFLPPSDRSTNIPLAKQFFVKTITDRQIKFVNTKLSIGCYVTQATVAVAASRCPGRDFFVMVRFLQTYQRLA